MQDDENNISGNTAKKNEAEHSVLLDYLDEKDEVERKAAVKRRRGRSRREAAKGRMGRASFKDIFKAMFENACDSINDWGVNKGKKLGLLGAALVPFIGGLIAIKFRIMRVHGVELTIGHFLICIVVGVVILFLKEMLD
ncbi:hypothetical protein JD969_02535 [Planctomycetota bacterium]|nr:hypothetical protein JD969_02535 [Planctomycetota bacterium]